LNQEASREPDRLAPRRAAMVRVIDVKFPLNAESAPERISGNSME
jgi:hypothetical protein